jgi:hypothetical protein
VARARKSITVSLPLEMRGNPQKLLTSVRTLFGDTVLDWASRRILLTE